MGPFILEDLEVLKTNYLSFQNYYKREEKLVPTAGKNYLLKDKSARGENIYFYA
jgi:hypothetical protein